MPKRKAEAVIATSSSNGRKKIKAESHQKTPLQKSSNLLDDSDSDSNSDNESEDGGVPLEETDFKINAEFARRFEHNKKREELQKCQFMNLHMFEQQLNPPQ